MVHIKWYLASLRPICATKNQKKRVFSNAAKARYGLRSIPGRKNKDTLSFPKAQRRMKKGKGTKNPHPIVMPIYHDIGKEADDGGRA